MPIRSRLVISATLVIPAAGILASTRSCVTSGGTAPARRLQRRPGRPNLSAKSLPCEIRIIGRTRDWWHGAGLAYQKKDRLALHLNPKRVNKDLYSLPR